MDRFGHARFQMPAADKLFTPVVTVLIALYVLGFALTIMAQEFVGAWLLLDPYLAVRGRVWQLVTYPFFTGSPLQILLDGIVVLVLGSAVEREWRSRSFLGLWFVVTILCALLWVMVCLITGTRALLGGMGSGAFGLVGAFGLLFRGRRFLWFLVAMESQTLAYLLIGIGVVFCIPSPINLVLVLGAPIAYGYVQLIWWLGARQESPATSGSDYRPGGFVDLD